MGVFNKKYILGESSNQAFKISNTSDYFQQTLCVKMLKIWLLSGCNYSLMKVVFFIVS